MSDQMFAPPQQDPEPAPEQAETEAEQAEAALPEQFEFAEWRLTVKGKPDSMRRLVERLEQTQVGRQLEAGRRLLSATQLGGNGER
jgi:hypothetical protein